VASLRIRVGKFCDCAVIVLYFVTTVNYHQRCNILVLKIRANNICITASFVSSISTCF